MAHIFDGAVTGAGEHRRLRLNAKGVRGTLVVASAAFLLLTLAFTYPVSAGTSPGVHAAAATVEEQSTSTERPGGVLYWTATDSMGIFDDQTLDFIADRAGLVVIRSPLEGPAQVYDYANVIDRIHDRQSDLQVLMYAWATTHWAFSQRIEQNIFEGYDDLGDLLIPTSVSPPGRPLYGDVTQQEYRDWANGRISTWLDQTGADGVAIDLAFRNCDFRPRILNSFCQQNPAFAAAYPLGVEQLFDELGDAVGSAPLLYNGIWTFGSEEENLIETQKLLLPFFDAVLVENFGRVANPNFEPRGWDLDFKPYLDTVTDNPDKMFAFAGRGSLDEYVDYEDDYEWQRYLYASYLLVARENTTFKYQSSFQIPAHAGRTGGLDTYSDWDLDLGAATGPYDQTGELYVRDFDDGLVLVLTDKATDAQTYELPGPMFTPEGQEVEGLVEISPGSGLILSDLPQDAPNTEPLVMNFEDDPAVASWRWASVVEESGNHFLRVENTAEGEEWEHDLLLEGVKPMHTRPELNMRVRTADPDARLQLVAEVDDSQGEHQFVVLEIDTEGDPPGDFTLDEFPAYRARVNWTPMIPHAPTGITLPVDGSEWSDLAVSADELLGGVDGGRFSFRRWSHVGLVGSMDVDDVIVGTEACSSAVSGHYAEPLIVQSGTTCLYDATLAGPVTVRPGASLRASGTAIDGPVAASGPEVVELRETSVGGPVIVSVATDEIVVDSVDVSGALVLMNNHSASGPILVAANTVDGPLSCVGNTPAPVNDGRPNTVGGPMIGQCVDL